MTDLAAARHILDTLIGFDTTSRHSNLALIEWVEEYLARHGVASQRVPNESGEKANLFATCGPVVEGGVILSGHTDVVPVDGQDWSSDPWTVRQDGGKLFGRGVADMKGFIALALAFVPRFVAGRLPVHLALSYDEEVGCQGAPAMIARMAKDIPPPRLAIVGEPSLMGIITGHKGIAVHEVSVRGHAAHSSLVDHGISANAVAVYSMRGLRLRRPDPHGIAGRAGIRVPLHRTLFPTAIVPATSATATSRGDIEPEMPASRRVTASRSTGLPSSMLGSTDIARTSASPRSAGNHAKPMHTSAAAPIAHRILSGLSLASAAPAVRGRARNPIPTTLTKVTTASPVVNASAATASGIARVVTVSVTSPTPRL